MQRYVTSLLFVFVDFDLFYDHGSSATLTLLTPQLHVLEQVSGQLLIPVAVSGMVRPLLLTLISVSLVLTAHQATVGFHLLS